MYRIIDHLGIQATGVMGESRMTNDTYNHRTLYEYDLYVTDSIQNQKPVKVTFDDMVLPYYGPYSEYLNTLPPVGTAVPVKYLPYFPRFFIIPADTSNPFLAGMLCQHFLSEYHSKKSVYQSVKNKETARDYYQALKTVVQQKCIGDSITLTSLEHEMQKMEEILD